MRVSGSAMLVAAATFTVLLAGCGAAASSGSGNAAGSTAGSTAVSTATSTATSAGPAVASPSASPGHDTPQDVATGIIQAELAGNWALLCSYIAPAQQASCKGAKLPTPKGEATVDGAVISGNRALVKVTGKICFTGGECHGNTNPEAGMPTGSETFGQAYDKQLKNGAFSPIPCSRINGKWYANAAS
jgi:hypothetical protein